MAKTYGQLPSYVQANATTFDLMVMDVAMTWEAEQQNRAAGTEPKTDDLSPAELIKILKDSRGEK